jgi:hypothetical protein
MSEVLEVKTEEVVLPAQLIHQAPKRDREPTFEETLHSDLLSAAFDVVVESTATGALRASKECRSLSRLLAESERNE